VQAAAAPKDSTLALLTLPELNLEGITDPEKLMKAALSQMMAGLHSELPKALQHIAARRPDVVIQFYRDMIEYLMPKLSRLEQSGTINHQHQHFVAVEGREADPRLLPAIEGEVVEETVSALPVFAESPALDTVPLPIEEPVSE
jgi:hypothetical protein